MARTTEIKKIVWLTDFDEKEHQGGAQQTNKIMIDNSPFKVEVVKNKDFGVEMIKDGVLFIINNIVFLSDYHIKQITEKADYIRYCHDYECVGKLKDTEFYKNSLMNIFLSPMHQNEYERQIGYKIEKVELQNSPVDTNRFSFKKGGRTKELIWVGQLNEHKGINNVRICKDES